MKMHCRFETFLGERLKNSNSTSSSFRPNEVITKEIFECIAQTLPRAAPSGQTLSLSSPPGEKSSSALQENGTSTVRERPKHVANKRKSCLYFNLQQLV